MANGFFNKLNHLVKAHINDIVSPIDERTSRSRRQALARQDIRGGLENDVKTLRQRIDDALNYEDELQSKVSNLYDEIAKYDQEADAAVADGRESDARRAIGRIQQAQREIQMLEADLQEHRFVTQELISQVNTLEGIVQQSKQDDAQAAATTDDKTNAEKIGETIVKQLDNTRQKLSELINNYTQQVEEDQPQTREEYTPERRPRSRSAAQNAPTLNERKQAGGSGVSHPVDRRKVDDEYSARLSRLSKPDKDEQ